MGGIDLDEFDMDEYDLEQEQAARIQDEIEVEDRLIEMMVDWYLSRGEEPIEEEDNDQ